MQFSSSPFDEKHHYSVNAQAFGDERSHSTKQPPIPTLFEGSQRAIGNRDCGVVKRHRLVVPGMTTEVEMDARHTEMHAIVAVVGAVPRAVTISVVWCGRLIATVWGVWRIVLVAAVSIAGAGCIMWVAAVSAAVVWCVMLVAAVPATMP